jgi:3-keto-disaccharide hydrolase
MLSRCLSAATLLLGVALTSRAAEDEKAGANDNRAPDGFTALFNGHDLIGWQGAVDIGARAKATPEELAKKQEPANKLMAETWIVKDGILVQTPKVDAKGKKSGVNLQTAKDYGDFDLMVDWKIEKAGDSGIYLRGTPQVQIWDSDNLPASIREVDAHTGSGGLWNNPKGSKGKQPLKNADKPVGQWNTFHIVMRGDKVTVKLNGELVVDDAPLAPYKAFGFDKLPEKGPIELQYHGDKLWFKNVYIKELK